MDSALVINCDGGSRGNPGPAASAFVAYRDGQEIFSQGKFLGVATNNVAEYTAVLLALEWLANNLQFKIYNLQIILDSELVVRQLNGEYKIKNKKLQELALEIKNIEKSTSAKIFYSHVARDKNKMADQLVNTTLDSST